MGHLEYGYRVYRNGKLVRGMITGDSEEETLKFVAGHDNIPIGELTIESLDNPTTDDIDDYYSGL